MLGFGLDQSGMMGNEEMTDTSNIRLGSGRLSTWMGTPSQQPGIAFIIQTMKEKPD